jgi:pimeloyl-ACP methyl ester carboxylesterase
MRLEVVWIPGGVGTLSGLHYVPEGDGRSIALVLAHGFTAGKYSVDGLAGYLAGRGYEAVTFDFVGHKLGCSGGAMERTGQAAENTRDALAWLRRRTAADRIVLVGHSMGAASVLQVAAWERQNPPAEGPKLAGIVCMGMGLEPAKEFQSPIGQAMLTQRQDYVVGAPALELLTGLRTMVLAAREIGDLPALFLSAKQDVLVSPARVEALAALVGPSASVLSIDSSHLEAPDRSRGPIAQWLEKLA